MSFREFVEINGRKGLYKIMGFGCWDVYFMRLGMGERFNEKERKRKRILISCVFDVFNYDIGFRYC